MANRDRLEIAPRYNRHRNGWCYRIAWYLVKEDGLGTALGEELYEPSALTRANSADDRDHITATLAAGNSDGVERDQDGFFWRSLSDAEKALRAARHAVRTLASPWPDWALRAKAAGWRPPRGWKP